MTDRCQNVDSIGYTGLGGCCECHHNSGGDKEGDGEHLAQHARVDAGVAAGEMAMVLVVLDAVIAFGGMTVDRVMGVK